eukprot:jgi/Tetstr1/459639/TSEL_004995.t1
MTSTAVVGRPGRMCCASQRVSLRSRTSAKVGARAMRCAARSQQGEERGSSMEAITQVTLASTMAALAPSAAWAEEAIKAAPPPPSLNPFAGVTAQEATVLLLPVILYVAFNGIRAVNPTVKFGDFMFFLVAGGVFGNIFFILVFKQRLF